MTTTIKPVRTQAIAAQYECAAFALRQAARELSALPGVQSAPFWEWDQEQSAQQPLRLPIEFTRWTLIREAELLEARARGER